MLMIKYICRNSGCDTIECESSTCPNCGQRTELISSEIYYCPECNAPVFDSCCPSCGSECIKIGSDLRPVFAEERLMLECFLGKPMAFAGKSVWQTTSTSYWIDGKKIRISIKEFKKANPEEIIAMMKEYSDENKKYVESDFTNEHVQKFIELNKYRLNMITDEACDYVRRISSNFDESEMFVSFSGGKDSTVTSSLIMRALETESIMHIYGDTTLEYPTSADYISIFRKEHPRTVVRTIKNKDQDFNDLCNVVGPPSRVLRWCCTVFKTGAIDERIKTIFKDKKRILSFQGIRRSESASRSKYDRDSTNSKIGKQISASPIIDWLDFDIWLYILSNHIAFNDAYRQGFTRVGCWCCPNNGPWSELLSSIYMPEMYKKWHQQLYDFAVKTGKEDPKSYVEDGSWKARQGGNGLDYSKNAVVTWKPCAIEDNAFTYDLAKPISEDLYTLFKPFGILNFELGNKRLNEVYVLNRADQTPLLKLTGRIGSNNLRVTVLNKNGIFKSDKNAKSVIDNQITKYQTCIGCGYCQAVCKFNALRVVNTEPGNVSNKSIRYTIDPNMCVGCLECVKHFDGGCYMKKVLRVKKG